ncbi:ion transporter [Leptolyngbyaceae cyanobacterium UHCC 1019]
MVSIRTHKLKQQIYKVIEVTHHHDRLGKLFDAFMIVLISLNVLAFTFETVDSVSIPHKSYFNDFETISVMIFTLEYGFRVWTCTLNPRYHHPILGRCKFVLSPLSIVDFISILPYYLFLVFPNLVFVRELHLLRLARLFKIGRYSESMRTLGTVISSKREDLFSALFTVFTLLMISSSLMYYAEHAAQPDRYPNIPASMWWGIITLTSVGYGDVAPITAIGRLLGGIIAVLGLGLVALPTGIIASGFAEEVEKKRAHLRRICPHCGEDLDRRRQNRNE